MNARNAAAKLALATCCETVTMARYDSAMTQIRFTSAHIAALRFVLLFAGIFVALQYLYAAGRDGVAGHLLVDLGTVTPCAEIINLIDPHRMATAQGNRIASSSGSLSVRNGCEGTETLFLLLAAIAAFRGSWRSKLIGLLLGTALVYSLNLARLVVLFFAATESRGVFAAIHGYLAPTLMIVLCSLFFIGWAHRASLA